MDERDQDLLNEIRQALYMHGKLSLLFYNMMDEWIVHKWGEFSRLEAIQQDLFAKYQKAGLTEEANSLTLMELPKDETLIFRILTCGHLPAVLREVGLIQEDAPVSRGPSIN
ncbi:hypothetical protein [Metabacillus sp. SLBN-84]